MSRRRTKKVGVKFLQDRPAEEDFFGTHNDLAIAVASALASNPELRTIGLLGKWGSGKSTVLQHLEKSIGFNPQLSDIQTFTFDAWEHQGEPIRRSFLESLFAFLTSKNLIDKAEWQADVDTLTGRLGVTENIETPELTGPTKHILWSLLLVPLGLTFLGLDTLKEGLGRETSKAGQLSLLIAFLCLAIPSLVVAKRVFWKPGTSTNKEDVLGLIINKRINHTKTRTIKSPEPTSIEFSNTCSRLVSELKQRNYRLLCVVDNLDRLPAAEALEIWSTIRAIFSNIQIENQQSSHPFVLVPMDHSALLASFGDTEGNQAAERARSFIDKTFDLTFRVPPPVRSDWKAFLRKQMEFVFNEKIIEDRTMYFVEKVFDSKHTSSNEFPTPRTLNRFVNSVATTWLSRQADDFPIAVVSLFVMHFEEIDNSVLEFTQNEKWRYFDTDFPNWRDQIAALYFGVIETKSRQVLLERPIREAIDQEDRQEFSNLLKYPGAFKVFDDIVRGYIFDPVDSDSQEFLFKSAALLGVLKDDSEAVKKAWNHLSDRLAESVPAPHLDGFGERLAPFFQNLSRGQAARIVPAATRWLSQLALASDDNESFTKIGGIYVSLGDFCEPSRVPKITLRGEPSVVINALYWVNGNSNLEASIAVDVEFSKLVPELAKDVDDEDLAGVVSEVLIFRRKFPGAFPKENVIPLGAIRDASLGAMEREFSAVTSSAAENLGIMALMTPQSAQALDAMIDAGHLQSRLNETIAAGDALSSGKFVALAIARGKPFDVTQPLGDDGLAAMSEALDDFAQNPLQRIWETQAAGYSPTLMDQVLTYVVNNREFLADELDRISVDLDLYFIPLSRVARHTLAKKIGADPKRVENIGKVSPSSVLLDILSPLVRSGVPDAKRQCKTTVENLSAETWKSFLEGKSDWVLGLVEKCPTEFKLTIDSNALDAATVLIDQRFANLSLTERTRLRRLSTHFNIHAGRRLINAIVAHCQSNPKHALALLKTLGDPTAESVSSYMDGERLLALIDGLSLITPGRAWLEEQTVPLQKGLSRSNKNSKDIIRDWVRRTKDGKPRVRANWVEMMGHRLGLD